MKTQDLTTRSVPAAFYVSEVLDHQKIKGQVLEAINSMGVHSIIESTQSLSNTDWHLSNSFFRPYWKIVAPYFEEHISCVRGFVGFGSAQIENYWFQQYGPGDFHSWHGHKHVMFSSVYFLALSKKELSTTFKFGNVEFQVDVTEGQILTFPSCYLHESKPNDTNVTKTIIAFNSNMDIE